MKCTCRVIRFTIKEDGSWWCQKGHLLAEPTRKQVIEKYGLTPVSMTKKEVFWFRVRWISALIAFISLIVYLIIR